MTSKLHWIDVLNEQATWLTYDDAQAWLERSLNVKGSTEAVEDFNAQLNFLRSQLFAMHFSEQADLESINEKLSLLRIQLVLPSAESPLPALCSVNLAPMHEQSAIADLCATILMQFAVFAGEWLADPASSSIARCEGLYREPGWTSVSPVVSVPDEVELQWRDEITVLKEAGLADSPELLRCADFFVARKGRFCSDECRFRTFQIAKQLSQPKYLAEKQRRYRQRKNQEG